MDLVGIAKSVTSDDVAQKNYDGQMSPDLPWDGQSDVFFNKAGISTYKWNQVYPYRLIVIDVSKNNETVTLGSTSKTSAIDYFINGDGFCITQTLENNKWEFALPVTPQQLSIQDIYAISNTPTLRGIVEEHNGIKYKNITMAGTFGILTKRNAAIDPLIAGGGKSLFGSIAGGTIEAVNQVISTASKLSNIGHHPAQIDAGQNKISSDNNREFGTGYYYAMLCGQFLEQYAIAKKDPKNSSWRLVLDIPKRSESYVVTPVSYTSSQSINKPAEYMFQMQLKAWKRIDLNGKENVKSAPNKISLNALQSLNNTIRNLRTLVAQSTNVLKAVRADFQALMNTIRQASLLVKDVAGFVQTAINLGPNIIKDCSDTIHEAGLNLSTSFQMPNGSATSNVSQVAKAATTVGLIKGLYAKNEGIAATVADQADFNKSANNPSNSTNNTNNSIGSNGLADLVKKPEENFVFLDTIPISVLNLTRNQQDAINDELTLIRLTTTADLKNIKNTLQSVAFDLTNHYGAGNSTIASIYGRDVPHVRTTPMTIEENELIQAFYEVIAGLDVLTASKQFDTTQQLKQTSLELVGGLASAVDIQIPSYNSKYQAPVPYGLSIEQIAMRYLKYADKWIEIVTLNALREPYIDEVGFSYPLLSNSDGRSFTVNDSSLQLFIGQKVTLSDTNTLPFVRIISDISKVSDTSFLITVDGYADLTLSTINNAKLQAYLPGTVNSQNIIYIPSNLPSDTNSDLFPIPNLKEDKLNNLANVDFLLDDSGDIAINSVGDFRLSNGLTNLIQTLKLKIQTKKGSLLRHDQYGLGITAGMSVADINSGELIKSLNEMIAQDPRFTSISTIQMTLNQNILNISMVVNLANRTGVLPINFDTRI